MLLKRDKASDEAHGLACEARLRQLRSVVALWRYMALCWALSTSLGFLYDRRFGQNRGNHLARRTAFSLLRPREVGRGHGCGLQG